MLKDILKRLTQNYKKDENSNVYKLIKLFSDELLEVKDALELTEQYRDIFIAQGNTLDRIGMNVQEPRLNRTDEEYRQAILIKISSNTSGGDIEKLNQILTVLLDGFEKITEGHQFEPPLTEESAAILITVLAQEFNPLPLSAVNRITAAGVRTYWELVYQKNIKLISEFEALLAFAFESNISFESDYVGANTISISADSDSLEANEDTILAIARGKANVWDDTEVWDDAEIWYDYL